MNHGNMNMPTTEASMNHNNMNTQTTPMNHNNNQNMGNMGHSNMNSMSHSMPMSFYFGNLRSSLLFSKWLPQTEAQLVGACFAVFFMTIFFFVLQSIQKYLYKKYPTDHKTKMDRLLTPSHWLHAFLHFVTFGWGYFLMLLAMSYNAWIFVSICLGSFVGFLFFGSSQVGDKFGKNDCC